MTEPSKKASRPSPSRPRRRERWTLSKGLAFVEDWKQSGETEADFCQQRGVGLHRLQYWARRAQEEGPPDVHGFVEVTASSIRPQHRAVPTPAAPDGVLEIAGPRGITLRLPISAGAARVAELIRMLSEVVQ